MPALVIAFGKKKPGASKASGAGIADKAFGDYMREKGKKPEGDDGGEQADEDQEVSAAEEEGKSAADDFAEAAKAGDGGAMWKAFRRMYTAAKECEGDDDEEAESDDAGDSADEEG